MATLLQRFFRHMGRRGEAGQSIILLAIGFIALAGFVGITVDVSLMFVRYAQLSRAVDSAAIAAANQMRQDKTLATVGLAARQFIEFHGLNPESVWVDTCLTQPGDPELCTADQAKLVRVRAFVKVPTVFMRLLGIQSFDLVAAAVSQTAALDVVLIMDVSESMASDTSYADWAKVEHIDENPDPTSWGHKNYGVVYRAPRSVDILSNLPGMNSTIANDFGAGNSINNLQVWWEAGNGPTNKATIKTSAGVTVGTFDGLLQTPQILVNNRLIYRAICTTAGSNPCTAGAPGPLDPSLPNDATRNTGMNSAYTVQFNANYFTDALFPNQGYGSGPSQHPREECRVRFYPSGENVGLKRYFGYIKPDGTPVTLASLYGNVATPGVTATGFSWTGSAIFDGFVPTYLYYKCCNDPDGDQKFADETCQPFKQARDATMQFIQRIDFLRGDRAAFVTFDRTAFLVNPYGYANATAQSTGDETGRHGAMIDNGLDAFHTLRDLIGVRAEPSFYVYNPGTDPATLGGKWTDMSSGIKPDGTSDPINFASSAYDPNTDTPLSYNYPVYDNCPFYNAGLSKKLTLFDDALANIALPNELNRPSVTVPGLGMGQYTDFGRNDAYGYYHDGSVYLIDQTQREAPAGSRGKYNVDMAYENWASCRSGNVGAALREANNALLNPRTVRRFGTVWVIVMMSDGAAGATDPLRRNANKIPTAKPYQLVSAVGATPKIYGVPGDYGSLGACPFGDVSGGTVQPKGELLLVANDSSGGAARFPYCSDEDPRTRFTCDFRPLRTLAGYKNSQDDKRTALRDNGFRTPTDGKGGVAPVDRPPDGSTVEQIDSWNRLRGNLYDIDIDPFPNDGFGGCNPLYDVDDYAHDWADFIGLQNLAGTGTAQLPTIFTIGFGLGYSTFGTPDVRTGLGDTTKPLSDSANLQVARTYATTLCGLNPANCQGEQLLRYIADVGDNNQLDNDYWQDAMQEYYNLNTMTPGMQLSLNGNMEPVGMDKQTFDRRDPCQEGDGPNSSNSYDLDNDGQVDLGAEQDREWGAFPANRSCGNYYYAPDGNELQFVFDDIASRMFTRLSR